MVLAVPSLLLQKLAMSLCRLTLLRMACAALVLLTICTLACHQEHLFYARRRTEIKDERVHHEVVRVLQNPSNLEGYPELVAAAAIEWNRSASNKVTHG